MRARDLAVEHLRWLTATAMRLCRDRFDADDLLQETLCKIISHERDYNPDMPFRPWAKTIMANIFRRWIERRGRVPFDSIYDDMPIPSMSYADDRAILSDSLDIIGRLRAASVCVEPVLLFAGGYSYVEISDILGIGIGTVKSRISLGRKMLRAALCQ